MWRLAFLVAIPVFANADEPKLFAEGVISSPFDDFGATVTPDGKTMFLTRSVPRSNVYVILESHERDGRWSEPEVAPFSGQYWDFDPVISPDGTRMVFSSDRPVPGEKKADKDFDIWAIDKTPTGWSAPWHLGPTVNSSEDETFASIARNGTLYFTSSREGGRENLHVYRARPEGKGYGPAEKLVGAINRPENLTLEAVVAPDESFIFVAPMGRTDGVGSFDVYVSYAKDGEWTEPKDVTKINTRSRDYSPRFMPDGKTLMFSSERGISTEPRTEAVGWAALRRELAGTLNGWGNIYTIALADLGLELGK